MNDKTKFTLSVLAIALFLVLALVGLLVLSGQVAERYGFVEGMLALVTPVLIATFFAAANLIKTNNTHENNGTDKTANTDEEE